MEQGDPTCESLMVEPKNGRSYMGIRRWDEDFSPGTILNFRDKFFYKGGRMWNLKQTPC